MRNTRTLRQGLPALLLLVSPALASAAESPAYRTRHYDLYVEGVGPDRVGRLFKALYAVLKAETGAEPGRRLSVHVFRDLDAYTDAAVAASWPQWRDAIHQSNGIYIYEDRGVYAWLVAGTSYATVNALLHEGTHQFFAGARTHNRKPAGRFYEEGLANHYAEWLWDGQSLHPTPADQAQAYLPAGALAAWLGPRGRSFKSLATDRGEPAFAGVAESWALVTFLIDREPDRFARWSKLLDEGADADAAWEAALADAGEWDGRYEAWLRDVLGRQRWSYSRGHWRADGPAVAAVAAGNKAAMAVLKRREPTLSVRIATRSPGGDVGLILDFRGESDFALVKVDAAGRVIGSRLDGGRWTETFRTAAGFVADRGDFVMTVAVSDGVATVEVNGRQATRQPVRDDGREGYWLAGAGGSFAPVADAPRE